MEVKQEHLQLARVAPIFIEVSIPYIEIMNLYEIPCNPCKFLLSNRNLLIKRTQERWKGNCMRLIKYNRLNEQLC